MNKNLDMLRLILSPEGLKNYIVNNTKKPDTKGRPPKWSKRYYDYQKICEDKDRNYILITTEKQWIFPVRYDRLEFSN